MDNNNKKELLSLLLEKTERLKKRRSAYKPNSGQIVVHKCNKTVRAVFSGNGSGKSTLTVHEVMWRALGYNPILNCTTKVPATIIVVLDTMEKVEAQWIPEIQKWFNIKWTSHKRGTPYPAELSFQNGSCIKFYSHNKDPLTFEGIEVDFVAFDEPPPRHIYVSLRRGGRKLSSKSQYLIVGTPIAVPWLRKEIYEPWKEGKLDNVECFRYSSSVNKANIDWEYMEEFFDSLGEKERRIREHGEFFDLEGLALAQSFDHKKHLVPAHKQWWRSSWPVAIGIDPHPNKAHVAVMIGADPDNNLYVLKEIGSKSPPRAFAKELREWSRGYRIANVICDSLGASDTTGGDGNKSFIEVLNEEGIFARSTTYHDKSESAWIMRIQNALAIKSGDVPKLRIDEDCINLINDIRSVQWKTYRNKVDIYKPSLEMEFKDYLSALKYALATNLRFTITRTRVIYPKEFPKGYHIGRTPEQVIMSAKKHNLNRKLKKLGRIIRLRGIIKKV